MKKSCFRVMTFHHDFMTFYSPILASFLWSPCHVVSKTCFVFHSSYSQKSVQRALFDFTQLVLLSPHDLKYLLVFRDYFDSAKRFKSAFLVYLCQQDWIATLCSCFKRCLRFCSYGPNLVAKPLRLSCCIVASHSLGDSVSCGRMQCSHHLASFIPTEPSTPSAFQSMGSLFCTHHVICSLLTNPSTLVWYKSFSKTISFFFFNLILHIFHFWTFS